LNTDGQVAFVTVEAGSGKTTLVRAFIAQSQRVHPDLLVAMGSCNVQGGIDDPYLPFQEVLASLAGVAHDRADVTNPSKLDRQLIILVDDLHWADDASIRLLFHLSQRIDASRILLIGAYRQDELAMPRPRADWGQRHPLAKILDEIKHDAGNVWIDLDEVTTHTGRAFVDKLVDSQPNHLDHVFRQALYERTDGHAFFTVELLRTFQERGDIAQDDQGCWVASPILDWQKGNIHALN
jgi:predicted ATPase